MNYQEMSTPELQKKIREMKTKMTKSRSGDERQSLKDQIRLIESVLTERKTSMEKKVNRVIDAKTVGERKEGPIDPSQYQFGNDFAVF